MACPLVSGQKAGHFPARPSEPRLDEFSWSFQKIAATKG
jgi:hypothetical protein